jgi:hypothetical protein
MPNLAIDLKIPDIWKNYTWWRSENQALARLPASSTAEAVSGYAVTAVAGNTSSLE